MLAFLGAWLRAGEGIGWLAAGTMPNSLYRMPLVCLFLACVFCYSCSFLFVVFLCVCVFLFSHWSFVDVPLIFFCPADHVPDWQPRILLGMVEARSVNVKKTTTEPNLWGLRKNPPTYNLPKLVGSFVDPTDLVLWIYGCLRSMVVPVLSTVLVVRLSMRVYVGGGGGDVYVRKTSQVRL